MILLITLWFNGFNMTIDGFQMYGIRTIEQCEKHLDFIVKDMYAKGGVCLMGDILQESHES
tara:strand:+ start:2208 stop:2390 length:183 start_codon:yes stop_codon:yes gene_type:complete